MSNVIPFRKKPVLTQKPKTTIKMSGCHFEENGVGMLLGEGVEVDMESTTFLNNGAGIVAGSIDERILQILSESQPKERFRFANELSQFANISDIDQRTKEIEQSSLASKLSTASNLATVTTWINDVIEGVSSVDFEVLLNAIMGG
ncbi:MULTISPECIES: hypothetical protein [Vibrio]|uniref:hypothetical protein n=1 Tax=Vibrio TaxID=662 RepID=UPI0002C49152|nr:MULTISPECIES: hypothetical protein [Vibrio]EMR36977.1 hypothetical protein MUQ_10692 [Vibrio harveyi CAIM 1792]HCG6843256.1 hypothetical protein [Vibrio parahaemolyticus]